MKLKSLLLLSICCLLYNAAAAQSRVTYYKNNGRRVPNSDSADYVRVLTLSDTTGKVMYNVKERYMNGNLKLEGKTSQTASLVFEGRIVKYYPTGKVKQVANYVVNIPDGYIYDYYPNGKLYRLIKHEVDRPAVNSFVEKMPLILTCLDSTGVALVTDGDGHYIGYSDDFKTIAEQGYVKGGLKTGQWVGQTKDGDDILTYTEKYADGKMLAGKSTDKYGKTYEYKEKEVNPVVEGGDLEFGRFLRDNIRYPKSAKENNIQGRVFVSFNVGKDGSLADIKVERAPSVDLGDEAVRVISLTKWKPGYKYGKPVVVHFVVPINFSLSRLSK